LAFRAARKDAGRWLPPGECLRRIAAHFIAIWKPILAERNTLQKQVLARDRGFCQVPGCSRAAVHAHHINPRSQGGTDDEWNLVSLCALCRARIRRIMPSGGLCRVRSRHPSVVTLFYAA